jgi:thymidine kinase
MSLHLIIGPMFSGKTTELIRLKDRDQIAGLKCVVIKYDQDTRYSSDQLSTHNLITTQAIKSVGNKLQDTLDQMNIFENDSIFIDEIQMYEDAGTVCDQLAFHGYKVTVSGLSGDYRRQPFGAIPQLIAQADKITHLTAVDAQTGQDAPFSLRTTSDTQQTKIGGSDTYKAVSRRHYYEATQGLSPTSSHVKNDFHHQLMMT